MDELSPEKKLDIEALLDDIENYEPRRKGWSWRKPVEELKLVDFTYDDMSQPLENSIPLPAARSFEGIDPQPEPVITTEIASGRFEDDLRRMRMAAWHGADHLMVIRTAGQSHFDGLIEGTPEGVGGIPITRKQIRVTRKALDLVEDEVGRELNFHSYVSGVAGPEIGVLFAEEGVNGAHQDPQYNVLYRDVNMYRSFVDAAVAKRVMASVDMLQIDGAHNANATARKAWKVMPELFVQHAINSMFSLKAGMEKEFIALSTVPPAAPPAPDLKLNLPYAVALREFFEGFRFRAQQNTKYMESSLREATVTHTLNLLISALTSADIQSTITPDEGRNVPWHYNNIQAVDTAKQAFAGLDGLQNLIELKDEEQSYLRQKAIELKERAILFMEEILEVGGYFDAVAKGFFVDSGMYPERNGDGIIREQDGGVAAESIVPRDEDYLAPVCNHFGYNNLPGDVEKGCDLIGGCTLEDRDKIQFIDELDPEDNVHKRLEENEKYRSGKHLKPEVEWIGDGWLEITLFLPTEELIAEQAAQQIGEEMNLKNVEVIHREKMHPAEGTLIEMKGQLDFAVDLEELEIPEKEIPLPEEEIREFFAENPLQVVAATVGEDEHSVGLREIIDIKHGGIEKYGVKTHYLGTSIPVSKVVDAAIETDADVIMISTIITHNEVHRENMQKLHDLCRERGVRNELILIGGGTQITDEIARKCGMDAGFGRGTTGEQVASYIVKKLRGELEEK
ncbi:D-ornithine 4,5-aminomutase subunit OraE [Halarsenatibacter silvermanii]|uniref:D-ornithine 4,5-aminomutase E subunit n=1 Tax=Halarsenatibacter silvermanii TaxID=321763 RepID=A0A1G9QS49_9FIRM|nr:D-ornithine 4,5-aminomutase subunit OraE [Halarsenatibacter silvermanii]SDM13816.1 D-ornithine 4,5-aminomutase E subunit [Halarsenatibacter silvermanii]